MTVLRHVLCALTGAATGLAAVAVHRSLFPVGLLLALVATFGVAWWLQHTTRPGCAASYALGWLLVLGTVLAGRPEGDYAIAADLRGYALLGAALVLAVVGLVAVARGRDAGPDSDARGS